jgi:hypothetical protein
MRICSNMIYNDKIDKRWRRVKLELAPVLLGGVLAQPADVVMGLGAGGGEGEGVGWRREHEVEGKGASGLRGGRWTIPAPPLDLGEAASKVGRTSTWETRSRRRAQCLGMSRPEAVHSGAVTQSVKRARQYSAQMHRPNAKDIQTPLFEIFGNWMPQCPIPSLNINIQTLLVIFLTYHVIFILSIAQL